MTDNKLDVLLMTDNSVETVGGEQESTKIILEGIKEKLNIGLLQPGNLETHDPKITYYELCEETRLKHIIKKPKKFLKYIYDVKNIINKQKPKIIHTQSQVSFFIVALLKKIRLIPYEIKIIHTERSLYIKYNSLFRSLFFFFMQELHTLVTTTNLNRDYWKEALEGRNLTIKYKMIENTAGKNYEEFDSNKIIDTQDTYIVGFSGRYHEVKNWPLAIEISKKLNNILGEKIEIKMTVGCLDKSSLTETKLMFKEMSRILGNRFDGKINVGLEEMDRFYYSLDFFILTSHHNGESFGRTIVEAMSRKTVVLTTDAGGPVEVVGEPLNVFSTSDDFVKRIIEFIDDEDKMSREKEKNMRRVKEKYSLKNNLKKHIKIYNSILT